MGRLPVIRADGLFVLFALVLGGMTFLLAIRDVVAIPMGESYHGGDLLTLATYAQALLHPHLYVHDAFLANSNHILVQDGLYLRLLTIFGSWFPDIAFAAATMAGFLIILHLLGFFVLGKVLLNHGVGAIFFSLSCFVFVPCGFDDWAYSETPVSRALLAALFPLVLAAFIHWRNHTDKWPWLMILAGVLTHAHIYNGPVLNLALWLGLLVFKPPSWSWSRLLTFWLFCGLASLAVQLPRIVSILGTMDWQEPVSYAMIQEIVNYNDRKNWFFQFTQNYIKFIKLILELTILPYWLTATLGVGWMIYRRQQEAVLAWFFTILAGVILTLGGVMALVDFQAALHDNRFPLLALLSRNMPLLIPLMLAMTFYTIQQWSTPLSPLSKGWVFALLWLGWQLNYPGLEWKNTTTQLSCWSRGNWLCPPRPDNMAEFYQTVREVLPPGRPVLALGYDYPLRIMAKVSLVYAKRDQKYLIQTSKVEMVQWYKTSQTMDAIRRQTNPEKRLLAWRDLARKLGAEYVVFSKGDWQENQHHKTVLASVFPKELRHTPQVGVYKID